VTPKSSPPCCHLVDIADPFNLLADTVLFHQVVATLRSGTIFTSPDSCPSACPRYRRRPIDFARRVTNPAAPPLSARGPGVGILWCRGCEFSLQPVNTAKVAAKTRLRNTEEIETSTLQHLSRESVMRRFNSNVAIRQHHCNSPTRYRFRNAHYRGSECLCIRIP
jgi:hypothetical protein